ncbi:MAG: YggS family pyridoxal phosphate-dependent enzyme [Actinomycetota bacterium]
MLSDVTSEVLRRNSEAVLERIEFACARAGRAPGEVRLVAVTKTLGPHVVAMARALGIRDFGENYVQELRGKRSAAPDATWHYVGRVQSNTAKHVAELADFVHGLEPGGAASRLSRRAETRNERLPVLVQVDFTGNRAGAAPEEVPALAEEISALEGLTLAGLMTLPPMPEKPEDARPYFRRLRLLRDRLLNTHPEAVELSMGMSLDYEVAVEEGATMVRIGTALFGQRPPNG